MHQKEWLDIRFKYYEYAWKNAGICLLRTNDVRQYLVAESIHLKSPASIYYNSYSMLEDIKIYYFKASLMHFSLCAWPPVHQAKAEHVLQAMNMEHNLITQMFSSEKYLNTT